MRKVITAKKENNPEVVIWGSGKPLREFLHVDDLADASLYLMNHYDSSDIINVGVGEDITIKELAEIVQTVVGYTGQLTFNTSRPDGTPRKLLDVTKLHATGWSAKTLIKTGIADTYKWYTQNINDSRV